MSEEFNMSDSFGTFVILFTPSLHFWYWLQSKIRNNIVKLKNEPKFFSLQVSVFNGKAMVTMLVISIDGWHPRQLPTCSNFKIEPNIIVFGLLQVSIFNGRTMTAIL